MEAKSCYTWLGIIPRVFAWPLDEHGMVEPLLAKYYVTRLPIWALYNCLEYTFFAFRWWEGGVWMCLNLADSIFSYSEN